MAAKNARICAGSVLNAAKLRIVLSLFFVFFDVLNFYENVP